MVGGGIAGTLAALPMPLGSLTEPLSPRAFAGPGGMPLTPASWAGDVPGAARRERTAALSNAALAVIHPREKIETELRAPHESVIPCRPVRLFTGTTGKHPPKFQGKFPKGGRQAAPYSPSYRLALVKPGWSVAQDVVDASVNPPAAPMRATVD